MRLLHLLLVSSLLVLPVVGNSQEEEDTTNAAATSYLAIGDRCCAALVAHVVTRSPSRDFN